MSSSIHILVFICCTILLVQIWRVGLHWLRVRRRQREFDLQWQLDQEARQRRSGYRTPSQIIR